MSEFKNWYIVTSKTGKDSDGIPMSQILCREGLEQAQQMADKLGIPKEDQSIIKYDQEY